MPSGKLVLMGDSEPDPIVTGDFLLEIQVVLFGLPGAFAPTCSVQHVPSYVENHTVLAAKGEDALAYISVNDAFVMGAWGHDQHNVTMLAGGSAHYTRAWVWSWI